MLPLVDDEAYYWTWSRLPALSYFDHPAGIAILIRASTDVLGRSALAVHLPAIICLAVSSWILGHLFTRLSPHTPETAWKAVFLLNLAPTFGVIGTFSLPDAPLIVCWTACLYLVHRAVHEDRLSLWYPAGLMGALALVSKYTAILLPLSVFLYLAAQPGRRRWLRRPQPYVAAGLMALGLIPILVWNVEHGWASFRFHLIDRHPSAWQPAATLGRFVAGQLLLTPALVALAVASWIAAFRQSRRGDDVSGFVFWMSVPSFAFFLALGTFTMSFPYWTAVCYLLTILPAQQQLDRMQRWVRATTWWTAVAVTIFMFGQVAWPVMRFNPKADPSTTLHGWDEVAGRLAELTARCGDPPCFVFSHRYQDSALASFHTSPAIEVTRLTGRHDQYDIWRDERTLAGRDAIYFCDNIHYQAPNPSFPFKQCDTAGTLPIVRDGRLLRTVSFWRCRGYVPQ